jgi:hypothetical protein
VPACRAAASVGTRGHVQDGRLPGCHGTHPDGMCAIRAVAPSTSARRVVVSCCATMSGACRRHRWKALRTMAVSGRPASSGLNDLRFGGYVHPQSLNQLGPSTMIDYHLRCAHNPRKTGFLGQANSRPRHAACASYPAHEAANGSSLSVSKKRLPGRSTRLLPQRQLSGEVLVTDVAG